VLIEKSKFLTYFTIYQSMFDVKATRAWWDFFHRFSLLYTDSNFDYILVLGINLLQCHECQSDATQFIRTIGAHKTPFEKVHILHNYVNRKLKKKIFDITETKQFASDVLIENSEGKDPKPDWPKLVEYYFNLIFLMTNYLTDKHLGDLKEFSAYVYRSIRLPKRARSLAINVVYTGKFNTEILRMQAYEYYRNFYTSLNLSNQVKKGRFTIMKHQYYIKSYVEIYGAMPKKTKTCKSCAKKHALYLEQHNRAVTEKNNQQSKQINRSVTPKVTPKVIKRVGTVNKVNPRVGKEILVDQFETQKAKDAINRQISRANGKRLPPSMMKLPKDLQKPMAEHIRPRQTVIKEVTREDGKEVKVVRKKVVPIKPRVVKGRGAAKPKVRRKIIFQRSRIIRYKQNRVESKNK